jgi:cytochrome c-type biogenesis protein CcmH/NrfG
LESAYLELRQARQAMQQGDPLQAITAYQELIRSGQLLPEVVEDLLQALERSPEDLALWQTLGDARLRQGDYQRALKAYEKAEGLL